MSWSSASSLSKRKDKQEKKPEARVEIKSVGFQQVKKKLKAKFEHLEEAELSEIAWELTTKEDITNHFSHLCDTAYDSVSALQAEERAFPGGEMDTDNEDEFSAACSRSRYHFDRHARLQVRLLLSPVGQPFPKIQGRYPHSKADTAALSLAHCPDCGGCENQLGQFQPCSSRAS